MSYGDLLNPNKFEGIVNFFASFEVKFDDFPSVLHKRVEGSGLRVAAVQSRDRGKIIALFVPFDYNSNDTHRPHTDTLLGKIGSVYARCQYLWTGKGSNGVQT
jgi:hypothetical protein